MQSTILLLDKGNEFKQALLFVFDPSDRSVKVNFGNHDTSPFSTLSQACFSACLVLKFETEHGGRIFYFSRRSCIQRRVYPLLGVVLDWGDFFRTGIYVYALADGLCWGGLLVCIALVRVCNTFGNLVIAVRVGDFKVHDPIVDRRGRRVFAASFNFKRIMQGVSRCTAIFIRRQSCSELLFNNDVSRYLRIVVICRRATRLV
jgi:hypothetical protein